MGLCEKCLGCTVLREENADGDFLICGDCGYKTPNLASIALWNKVYDEGQRKIEKSFLAEVKKIVAEATENTIDVKTGERKLAVPQAVLLNSLQLNLSEKINRGTILEVGRPIIREIIKREQKRLSEKIGCQIDFEAAARIVAFLFNDKTRKIAKIAIQKIEESQLGQPFTLSYLIPHENEKVITRPYQSVVDVVFGEADISFKKIGEGYFEIIVKPRSLPIVILYSSYDFEEESRLFIFK